MESRWLRLVSGALAFMTAVLLLDRPGLAAQTGLGLATAAFLWCFVRKADLDPRPILTAVFLATLGEVTLSVGWGLYTYQNAIIPLYVFPGHGVFYALAVVTARERRLQAHATAITRAVLLFGTLVTAVSVLFFYDTWGALWWLAAFVLIVKSEEPLLLASCVVYTLLLEWVGTAIGNWRWLPEVPFLPVHSANPPAGVSVLYIILDLLTVAACSKLWKQDVEGASVKQERPSAVPALGMREDPAGPG